MNLTYDSQMFRETFESEFTWLNGFMRNVRRFSDKPAAIDPQSGRTWSYKELNADANRFANAMKKDGLLFMFMMQTLCKQPYRLLKSASISQN